MLREIWDHISTARRTREREAAAEYERVHREGALRDDFARRTHALEAQIAPLHAEIDRLRAENRALLNSVLGIAGIPPVIVADPPSAAGKPAAAGMPEFAFVGAQHAVPGADACHARPLTAPLSHSRHSEERNEVAPSSRSLQRDEPPLLASLGCLDAKPERGPSFPMVAQDDGAVDKSIAPDGAASPSTSAGHSSAMPLPSETPLESASVGTNAAPPQKQLRGAPGSPRPRNDPHVIAPIRRRSWHQIYRMLEFESSRRKEREP